MLTYQHKVEWNKFAICTLYPRSSYFMRSSSPIHCTITLRPFTLFQSNCTLYPFWQALIFFSKKLHPNQVTLKHKTTYNRLCGLSWKRISFFSDQQLLWCSLLLSKFFAFLFLVTQTCFFLIQYYLTYEYVYSPSHKIDHLLNFIVLVSLTLLFSRVFLSQNLLVTCNFTSCVNKHVRWKTTSKLCINERMTKQNESGVAGRRWVCCI